MVVFWNKKQKMYNYKFPSSAGRCRHTRDGASEDLNPNFEPTDFVSVSRISSYNLYYKSFKVSLSVPSTAEVHVKCMFVSFSLLLQQVLFSEQVLTIFMSFSTSFSFVYITKIIKSELRMRSKMSRK